MIERNLQQQVEKRLRRSPSVAILGPRQVGKTTLAKTLAKLDKAGFTYLDMENPRDQIKLQDAHSFLEKFVDLCVIKHQVAVLSISDFIQENLKLL